MSDIVRKSSKKRKTSRKRAIVDSDWRDVSTDVPCPICGKPDWCSISHDGAKVHCRRTTERRNVRGWIFQSSHFDRAGQDYSVWRRDRASELSTRRSKVAAIKAKKTKKNDQAARADDVAVSAVYDALLNELKLNREHRRNLRKRGLTNDEIDRRGYRSLDPQTAIAAVRSLVGTSHRKQLSKVPGFIRVNKQWRLAVDRGMLVPVRDNRGRVVELKVRADQAGRGKKRPKYFALSSKKHGGAGAYARVHVPLRSGRSHKTVRITEGELKADVATAISGTLTLGLPGINSFRLALPVLRKLKPKIVRVAFDADYQTNPTVATALLNAIALYRDSFKVEVEVWPREKGKGIDDILANKHHPTVLRGPKLDKFIRKLETSVGLEARSRLPSIVISPDERRVNDEAIAALAAVEGIYQRTGSLVRITSDRVVRNQFIHRPSGSSRIEAVPEASLRELLSAAAKWEAVKKNRPAPAHVPRWAVQAVLSRGEWPGIRVLEAIVASPVLRRDGSILREPGYDTHTGLYFASSVQIPPVSDQPTKKQIDESLGLLRSVVSDFPFASDHHFAAWLAAVLTPLARHAFDGPAPLFLCDSNAAGVGKSLLFDTLSIIVTGGKAARMAHPRDDEEARKRVTSLAIAGDPLVLIDNIRGDLGSPSLEAAITGQTWSDRLLGASKMVTLPLNVIWLATGNNVSLTSDMARRTLHIRLQTALERPEEREGFTHPRLLRWVMKRRAALLGAALTILRGYWAAGRPDMHLTPWGSFEGWSGLVRSAIVWAGLPDPGKTRQALREHADTERDALAALMEGLKAVDPNGHGVTVAEIQLWINGTNPEHRESAAVLRDAIIELCPVKTGFPSNAAIGSRLRYLKDRVVGGRRLNSRRRNNTAMWFVEDCTQLAETAPEKSNRIHSGADLRGSRRNSDNQGPTGAKGAVPTPHGTKHIHKRAYRARGNSPLKARRSLAAQSHDTEVF